MKFILGKKIGMTRIFDKKGLIQNVSLIEAGPCYITSIKPVVNSDDFLVEIGYKETDKLNKPLTGHLKKTGRNLKFLKGCRFTTEGSKFKIGDKITVDEFREGDIVNVSGLSKGKGFSGVVKRHHFKGGPASHGSDQHRGPGSIGSAFPQHVFKGTRMAGRMGFERTTVKNLQVLEVNQEKNILVLKGATPGTKNSILEIKE